jgi:hypothetical protein
MLFATGASGALYPYGDWGGVGRGAAWKGTMGHFTGCGVQSATFWDGKNSGKQDWSPWGAFSWRAAIVGWDLLKRVDILRGLY